MKTLEACKSAPAKSASERSTSAVSADAPQTTAGGGLDIFRMAAAFLVIAIHTAPLDSFSRNADFLFTGILARVAVPFFFMVTGHFIASRFFNRNETIPGHEPVGSRLTIRPKTLLLPTLKKLGLLYMAATILYLPVAVYAGYYDHMTATGFFRMVFFDGTFYHLWYFPASMIGLALLYAMSRFMSLTAATIVSVFLYAIGLSGDSYFGIASRLPLTAHFLDGAFHLFSYTRNGLFFAPLFLLMGTWCGGRIRGSASKDSASKNRPVSPLLLSVILVFSLAAMTAEGFFLHLGGFQRHDSMYVMLIPVMISLYRLLLTVPAAQKPRLRPMSTLIYVIHPALIVFVRLVAGISGLEWLLTDNSLMHYTAVSLLSLAVALLADAFVFSRKAAKDCGRVESRYRTNGRCRAKDLCRVKGCCRCEPRCDTRESPSSDRLRDRAWAEIDMGALASNVSFLRSQLPEGCLLMPAVKAEAYGHGAVIIAKELNKLGVRSFCVACIDEGISLRKSGIIGEILILGYTHPSRFDQLLRYRLLQTAVDLPHAQALNDFGKKHDKQLQVHLAADTGMHRLGEPCENVEGFRLMMGMENLEILGIFTHLAASDMTDASSRRFTEKQLDAFRTLAFALGITPEKEDDDDEKSTPGTVRNNGEAPVRKAPSKLRPRFPNRPRLHVLASYGVLNYPEAAFHYARVGIALYGVLSSQEDEERYDTPLRPVLSIKARVASVRKLRAGESTGYAMAFTAPAEMKIAALTIGYADGLPRELSNMNGSVLIKGKRAPIIGRVCMDQTIVDISHIDNVSAGDVAVIIGSSGSQSIHASQVAASAGTITNEILSRLGNRLPRIPVGSSSCYDVPNQMRKSD